MALKGSTVTEQTWNYLMAFIANTYGVAALMGNLKGESGLNPKNMQNSCEKRLRYSDETYTAAVDSGEYTNFVRDSVGYGIAQWTYWNRKQNLLNHAKAKGKSIGDLETQLEFLCQELESNYKSVLSALKGATDIKTASDIVLTQFEKPKNQSDLVKKVRAGYGQEFFDMHATTGGKKVSVKVGSARIDENGKISGGAAGDQTGKEVCIENYYMHSKGWYLYRAKDAAIAERLASAMLNACNNDNIGYCQGHRTTVIAQLWKYGSMAAIKEKTEADCSSLVRGCCIEAGFDPGNFNTASEGAALDKTGMFESRKSVTSSTVLYNGDILVTKTKGHTVIVTSGNPRIAGNTSAAVSGNKLIRKLQSAKSKDNSLAGTYKTTTNLNLRYGPGKNKYDSIIILSTGTKCQCYGYYTAVSSIKWLYVVASVDSKQYTGFVSSKYLSR